jgi:hypothetical protein
MVDLSKVYLFRMTHIENIPHILQYGITHVQSLQANKSYTAIGDDSLISNRNEFILPNGKKLGEYVPFYFGTRMPMLYVIQKGLNKVKITPAEHIVYCISSVEQMLRHGIDFVFTNGHAIEKFSSFYDASDIEKIESLIDKEAISSMYWKDGNDLDKKRRKQAEFLVSEDISKEVILGFAVYNEAAKDKLIAFGIVEGKIVIREKYYF